MSKLVIKSKNKTKKLACRGKQFHHTVHTKGRFLDFCKTCNYYTDVTETDEGKVCYCCRKPFQKLFNKNWKVKILRAGFRQNSNAIKNWTINPTRDPFYVEILYKDMAYEIDIKYLALYLEQLDISEKEKIEMIGKHLHPTGVRIRYPSLEELDVPCHECSNLLVYDLEGKVFCKYCSQA